MSELKPCPFCGGTPRIVENKLCLEHIIYCVECDSDSHTVIGGWFDSENEAVEWWNRRADNDR